MPGIPGAGSERLHTARRWLTHLASTLRRLRSVGASAVRAFAGSHPRRPVPASLWRGQHSSAMPLSCAGSRFMWRRQSDRGCAVRACCVRAGGRRIKGRSGCCPRLKADAAFGCGLIAPEYGRLAQKSSRTISAEQSRTQTGQCNASMPACKVHACGCQCARALCGGAAQLRWMRSAVILASTEPARTWKDPAPAQANALDDDLL